MSEGLLRQRRNLISISCVLIFIKFSCMEISEISIFGVSFNNLGNPSAIVISVYIVFIYFLVRYYQYFMQEGFSAFSSIYKTDYLSKFHKYAYLKTREKSSNAHFEWNNKHTFTITVTSEGSAPEIGVGEKYIEKIPMRIFLYLYMKSLVYICLNKSVFTDYFLPFFLAIFTVLYTSTFLINI